VAAPEPVEAAFSNATDADQWCLPGSQGWALAALVPAGVALVMVDPRDVEPLHAAEEEAVSQATWKRRQDFRAGRAAARAALRRFGLLDVTIPRGTDRLPMWPAGFVGSISHCPGWGGAAVARRSDLAAIGLDIEVRGRVHSRLLATVCTPAEQAWMAGTGTSLETATLVFSAKEAVYKCVHPATKTRLAFADVEIAVDLSSGQLAATLPARLPPEWRQLSGRFAFCAAHVVTSFWAPAKAVDAKTMYEAPSNSWND
jgi:4'-phosphopantetheinyl transferase EntD